MTLLNGLLAFGALAFTIPLAIHLLFRSRFTTVDWGAMHLLDSVIRINRRRLQLMNLLLLLLRCLLPILLAFCLARPLLTGFQTLPGDAPLSLVIAIDDSRSLTARDESGLTRAERMRNDLREMIGGLSRRDEVILVRSSRVSSPAASMGSQDALRRIDQLTFHSGPLQLDRLMDAAINAAEDASQAQRRILVVSDFQSENVGDGAIEALARIEGQVADRPNQPIISFLNYGIGSDQFRNVSVDAIAVESPAVIAGRGARFSARIRNASDRVAQDLRLVWSIDGQPLPPRTISIPPRSTSTNQLSHRIDEAGVHQVTLAVEHADALAADNRRSIGVDVTDEINVLLLDGDPSSKPLEGETDFLAIALSPFAFGGEDLPDAVRTNVVTSRNFAATISEDRPDVLIMANVKDMSVESRALVADFVLSGGGLVLFDGDAVKPEAYNDGWVGDDGTLQFPAALGEFVGSQEPSARENPIPIGQLNPQYTPWSLLESKDDKPLNKVDIYGYRKLILPDASGSEEESVPLPPTITLLQMSGGDPLIVSARRGRGRVIQFGVPCDAGWSTLPMRMVYLPMMQQLMLDLAGSRVAATVTVGEGLSVPLREFDSGVSAVKETEKAVAENASTYTLQMPGGSEESIVPTEENMPFLVVSETDAPGVYRFRRSFRRDQGDPEVASTLRVVEVPSEESRLVDTDPSRLSIAADSVGAEIYTDVKSLQSDDRTRRFGREVWRWLLLALLVGMIGELLLQQRLVRRSVRREVV